VGFTVNKVGGNSALEWLQSKVQVRARALSVVIKERRKRRRIQKNISWNLQKRVRSKALNKKGRMEALQWLGSF